MQYHLLKEDGEWQLREEGSSDSIFTTETKADALEKLSDYMDSRDGSVAVHTIDGRIQEHRSFEKESESSFVNGVSVTRWSLIGVAAVAALTAAGVAYYFRGSIPTDRLRLPR